MNDTFYVAPEPKPAGAVRGALRILPGPRMKAALAIALAADILQMVVFPFFVEGAPEPADDLLDLLVAGLLTWLLGWHWEFLPSFAAKLIPGVDLVPLWTLAVVTVYRRHKPLAAATPATADTDRGPTPGPTPGPTIDAHIPGR